MKKPPYGRKETFEKTLELLDSTQYPTIVEIGMSRNKEYWLQEGHSTPLFAWYAAQKKGVLYSVDINQTAVDTCHNILKNYNIPENSYKLLCTDGIDFLKKFRGKIDLLYLDAWDYNLADSEIGEKERLFSEQSHLKCFYQASSFLHPRSLVLLDDIFNSENYHGKGRLLIPHLLNNGYDLDPVSYTPLEYGVYDPDFPKCIHQFLFIKT